MVAGTSPQTPLGIYNALKDISSWIWLGSISGLRSSSANFLIHNRDKNGFSLQQCTRLHAFKSEFSKIIWLTEPSPQTPPHSISDFVLESGFALNSPLTFSHNRSGLDQTLFAHSLNFLAKPLPRLIRAQFWQIHGSAIENLKDRFSFQVYTRWQGFKYEFSKIFWRGAHRAPSPDPSPLNLGLRPRFELRPQFSGALRPRFGLRPQFLPPNLYLASPLLCALHSNHAIELLALLANTISDAAICLTLLKCTHLYETCHLWL